MASLTFKGSPIESSGELPPVGSKAPTFNLARGDLSEAKLEDYSGKNIVLNIVHSLDTRTCAASARAFNEKAAALHNTVVLCISADLPFAQKRFCTAEGIENVEALSTFRNPEFGRDYGVDYVSPPLAGLLARAIVVIGPDGTVTYTEQVQETSEEPDYDAALAAIG